MYYSQPKSVKSKSVGHMTARYVNYSLRGHVTPTFWRVKKWNGSKTKNPLKINSELPTINIQLGLSSQYYLVGWELSKMTKFGHKIIAQI